LELPPAPELPPLLLPALPPLLEVPPNAFVTLPPLVELVPAWEAAPDVPARGALLVPADELPAAPPASPSSVMSGCTPTAQAVGSAASRNARKSVSFN
jgi:hypothetical protein